MDPMFNMVIMIVLFIAIFYFMIFRPNKKQQEAHKKLIENLRTNDKVIMSGGIHGTVSRVNDETVLIKVSDRTEIEFSKEAIRTVNPTETADGTHTKKSQEITDDDDDDFLTDEEIAEKRKRKKLEKAAAKEETKSE